jgi:hypothetical protein
VPGAQYQQGKCPKGFYQRFRRLRGRLGDVLMFGWLLFGPYQLILIAVAVFFIWEASRVVKELEGIKALLREIRDRQPRA